MTTPVLVLLGFAAWTLLTLFASIGAYRWSRILTGRASIAHAEEVARAIGAHVADVERQAN
jgi:hypothetical protein